MKDRLTALKNEAISNILDTSNKKELENLRIEYLGRQGKVNQILKTLKELPVDERKEMGRLANEVKGAIQTALEESVKKLHEGHRLESQWIDVTTPGIHPPRGHLHLVTQAIEEIADIFEKIGFRRVSYPEVEWDWFAFEALNMPKNHPARDEWETFFVDGPASKKYGEMVLTPHTSSGQIREMSQNKKPPIRIINIAKCYRRQLDVTHVPMFYQFEGLCVDKNINITHLKGVTDYFVKHFFGSNRKTRLRPFHFQFTEPSFEVDINCPLCLGRGCKTCKSGWHELGGAGMVHPQVFKNCGLDPVKYSGFAFGWGVERTYLMKSDIKIDDVRVYYQNDIRFLEQF